MKSITFPKTNVSYKWREYLWFLKGRMSCFSTFVEHPTSQQLAEGKNYLNDVFVEKPLPPNDLKSKDITYSVFSREKNPTDQPEKRQKSRKEASRQLLGRSVMCISHLSPMKIQKRRKNVLSSWTRGKMFFKWEHLACKITSAHKLKCRITPEMYLC